MALKSTIYRVELQISDLDRHYYADHTLTLAQHPSETAQRLMIRLLAFILNANENLVFCKGLSTRDEPDLWQKKLTGEIELWIETGQPDEKRLRKACACSERVKIYTYSGNSAEIWWQHIHNKTHNLHNLNVVNIPEIEINKMTEMVTRHIKLQATIEDEYILLTDGILSIEIHPQIWK